MIGLSAVLLGLGAVAAWNVHEQQQASSDLIAREMHTMLAIENLHIEMRDVRYFVNLFLRTGQPQRLADAIALQEKSDTFLDQAKSLARTDRERELIAVVDQGYRKFFTNLKRIAEPVLDKHPDSADPNKRQAIPPELVDELTELSDELMTNEVLEPLRECISFNQEFVERTNTANQQTAQHLKIGFLLLGICGAAAGLLIGTSIARGIGRSMVQLNVSVRSMAGKLQEVKAPVTISHTTGFQGIESDLRSLEDEIAQVVERLQQRETELLRSEQLARVGQLAAGLAHELRNPLMPMKMLVQAALERNDDVGLKGRSLRIINDEIGRLEESIQAFLDFARPPVPEKTAVDINEVVQQVFDLINGRAKQQAVALRLNLPLNHVVATVDRAQIRQLILNLLLNALDAVPEEGTIDVHLDHNIPSPLPEPVAADSEESRTPNDLSEHDAMRLRNRRQAAIVRHPTAWFAIRIADNGTGIPPELLDTLFEPFVTTKETGTGLGLSICQRIATAHQGTLTVRNRSSGGAEFVLSLPYAL